MPNTVTQTKGFVHLYCVTLPFAASVILGQLQVAHVMSVVLGHQLTRSLELVIDLIPSNSWFRWGTKVPPEPLVAVTGEPLRQCPCKYFRQSATIMATKTVIGMARTVGFALYEYTH